MKDFLQRTAVAKSSLDELIRLAAVQWLFGIVAAPNHPHLRLH